MNNPVKTWLTSLLLGFVSGAMLRLYWPSISLFGIFFVTLIIILLSAKICDILDPPSTPVKDDTGE